MAWKTSETDTVHLPRNSVNTFRFFLLSTSNRFWLQTPVGRQKHQCHELFPKLKLTEIFYMVRPPRYDDNAEKNCQPFLYIVMEPQFSNVSVNY